MDTSLFTMLSHAIVALLALFVSPTLARANNHTLNCSDVNVVIGASARHGGAESLFAQLASFSGLDELVVPGGLFYEVTGDLTFFVPKDDALEAEIEYWKEALGLSGNETVRENKAYVQEILRQYIAYGNVSVGYRGLFVTIDGSIFNWTDASEPGMSKIELQPVGTQLLESPLVLYVNDTSAQIETCSRGIELARVVRDRTYVRMAVRRSVRRGARARGRRGMRKLLRSYKSLQ
tara:strand:+ start:414 stop:1118 length:705 start_codon:yes stop_codon:yes gene_type:complete